MIWLLSLSSHIISFQPTVLPLVQHSITVATPSGAITYGLYIACWYFHVIAAGTCRRLHTGFHHTVILNIMGLYIAGDIVTICHGLIVTPAITPRLALGCSLSLILSHWPYYGWFISRHAFTHTPLSSSLVWSSRQNKLLGHISRAHYAPINISHNSYYYRHAAGHFVISHHASFRQCLPLPPYT